jgi:type II secretory pathway predicted ATPase ExeA
VPYDEKDDGGGHAGHPARCLSWLLRAAILYLHPSGSLAAPILRHIPQAQELLAAEETERAKKVVVITDEAHLMSTEQLESLLLLTHADTADTFLSDTVST